MTIRPALAGLLVSLAACADGWFRATYETESKGEGLNSLVLYDNGTCTAGYDRRGATAVIREFVPCRYQVSGNVVRLSGRSEFGSAGGILDGKAGELNSDRSALNIGGTILKRSSPSAGR